MNTQSLESLVGELSSLAKKTIRDCTFPKDVAFFGRKTKSNLLLPSGDEKYGSFWVRDAAMMAESGLVSNRDLKSYIEIIAANGQNGGTERLLENGLRVPAYAIADHINYDGVAVFFPGVWGAGDHQGDGSLGFYPPFCDNYYFIMMVGAYVRQSKDLAILRTEYQGLSLLRRLQYAFEGYNVDPDSGLCVSDEAAYTVDWGFVDTVKKTGKLLMASILRYHAALTLSALCEALGENGKPYADAAKRIKESILETFFDEASGWFYSATGIGRQYDVWGTAYAVYSGITSDARTLKALHAGYWGRTAVVNGYVRHILSDQNFSATSAWESTTTRLGEYQNGAYWATPTGWYAYALYLYDSQTKILSDFLEHTKKHADRGAPFEWMDANTTLVSGLNYGTSGVLPYIGAKRILEMHGFGVSNR